MIDSGTIIAVATGRGGAIGMVRMSGSDAAAICDSFFRGREPLSKSRGYTLHYGDIVDNGRIVDDVIVSVFRAPRSYTGEDMVEISCHGSSYIQGEIVRLAILAGARNASAGEFTIRAFLNGKMDLSQAEAVADIIAAEERASQAVAFGQMRGGYAADLSRMRGRLIELSSLLELELDFSEEEVEFADRAALKALAGELDIRISRLLDSFALGNAIKEGICVAIVGAPNAGKSTLLNRLLNEERAMVSEIPGTTRDAIEERISLGGIGFRFIDTAGLREAEESLEKMGIERTYAAVGRSRIILYIVDASAADIDTLAGLAVEGMASLPPVKAIVVLNKIDLRATPLTPAESDSLSARLDCDVVLLSAKRGDNMDGLIRSLVSSVDVGSLYGGDTILSNSRHYEALLRARESLREVVNGLAGGLSSDLLAEEVRQAIYHTGTITGEVTTDEILATIFSKFCIGK